MVFTDGARSDSVAAMLVLRCTKKLLAALPGRPTGDRVESVSDTRLGDWAAHVFSFGRTRLVLGVSHRTLLPVVVPLAPNKTLVARFVIEAGEMLRAIDVEDRDAIVAEVEAMAEHTLATTNNRSVLGIVNDFVSLLGSVLEDRSVREAALFLARTPCSPLGMKRPIDCTREAFAPPLRNG